MFRQPATRIQRARHRRKLGAGCTLIVGLHRSSTTWTSNIIAAAAGQQLLLEPDGHTINFMAAQAKSGLGGFPVLRARDRAPAYEDMWERVFEGRWPLQSDPAQVVCERDMLQRSPQSLEALLLDEAALEPIAQEQRTHLGFHVPPEDREPPTVIKSVTLSLALDWFHWRFPDCSIVVVERHPLDVVASRLANGFGDVAPLAAGWREHCGVPSLPDIEFDPAASLTERTAWLVAMLYTVQSYWADRIGLTRIHHEAVCVDPKSTLEPVFNSLGLRFSQAAEQLIEATDRPGRGFEIERVRSQTPYSARKSLSSSQLTTIQRVFDQFGPTVNEYPNL